MDLFAGIGVSDYATAKPWYERLLGAAPSFLAHATEAVWELAEHRFLYIVQDAERAGRALHTIFVDDLDAFVADIASRGIEPDERVTYPGKARKAIYRDADGNEIGFGGAIDSEAAAPPPPLPAVLDAFNAHDLDAIMSFFTDDCVFDTPRGPAPGGHRLVGKDQVRKGFQARFDGIPDIAYGDERHWTCGDRGVSEWTIRGTTAAGDAIEVRGCDLFEFTDGKISRKDSFWKIVE